MRSFQLADDPYGERKPSFLAGIGIVIATVPLAYIWVIILSFSSLGLESSDSVGRLLWLAWAVFLFEAAVALPGAVVGHLLHVGTKYSLLLSNVLSVPAFGWIAAIAVGGTS